MHLEAELMSILRQLLGYVIPAESRRIFITGMDLHFRIFSWILHAALTVTQIACMVSAIWQMELAIVRKVGVELIAK